MFTDASRWPQIDLKITCALRVREHDLPVHLLFSSISQHTKIINK